MALTFLIFKCTLQAVTVVAGDERSAAISRYRELMVLLVG